MKENPFARQRQIEVYSEKLIAIGILYRNNLLVPPESKRCYLFPLGTELVLDLWPHCLDSESHLVSAIPAIVNLIVEGMPIPSPRPHLKIVHFDWHRDALVIGLCHPSFLQTPEACLFPEEQFPISEELAKRFRAAPQIHAPTVGALDFKLTYIQTDESKDAASTMPDCPSCKSSQKVEIRQFNFQSVRLDGTRIEPKAEAVYHCLDCRMSWQGKR